MKICDLIKNVNDCFNVITLKFDARCSMQRHSFLKNLIFAAVHAQSSGKDFTITALRENVAKIGKSKLYSRSGFWAKLSQKSLGDDLKAVLDEAIQSRFRFFPKIPLEIIQKLGVNNIYATDSTVNVLPNHAQNSFPGTFTEKNPASVKLHVLLDVLGQKIKSWVTSPGIDHDRLHCLASFLKRGDLLITDLGYYDFQLFFDLVRKGIFFLSRLKKNAAITLIKINYGIGKRHEGKRISEIIHKGKKYISATAIIKTAEGNKLECNVMGCWDDKAGLYHWYITNLECPASWIPSLYTCRWQIELLFKGMKSHFSLDEIPSGNPHIIKNLITIKLIGSVFALSVSSVCAHVYFSKDKLASITILRSFRFFVLVATEVYDCIRAQISETETYLRRCQNQLRRFINELLEPNRSQRDTSLKSLESILVMG